MIWDCGFIHCRPGMVLVLTQWLKFAFPLQFPGIRTTAAEVPTEKNNRNDWVRGLNNIKQKSLLCIAFCRYRTYCDLCRTSTYIIKSAIHSHPILYGTGLAHPLQEWIRRWCHTPWQFLCVEALFYFSSSCIHIQWILPISLCEDAQVRFCIRIPYNWQSTA